MAGESFFQGYEESQSERLARKAKNSPFMIAGLGGLACAVGYGAYMFNKRGKMSTSVYLMQLRVTAQGAVVVALLGGIAYSMFSEHLLPRLKKSDS